MRIPFTLYNWNTVAKDKIKVVDKFNNELNFIGFCKEDKTFHFSIRYGEDDTVTERIYDHPENHLFIVTTEEQLTAFENRLCEILDSAINYQIHSTHEKTIEDAKKLAPELLAIAKEQLDIEVLKDRAVELTKQLNESGLDENSIEYELIEFMCNLMDCPNWSEIVETAGLHADRIKAEALKDLPRWKVELGDMEYVAYGFIGDGEVSNPRVYLDGRSIDLYSLKKLPGFKEG